MGFEAGTAKILVLMSNKLRIKCLNIFKLDINIINYLIRYYFKKRFTLLNYLICKVILDIIYLNE